MTNVPCRHALVAVTLLVAVAVVVAGVVLQRWALAGGAVAGGVVYVAIACTRNRSGSAN